MFQWYQPRDMHARLSGSVTCLVFPSAWEVSTVPLHVLPWGCSFLLDQPCWPKRPRLLPRGTFLPARLVLFEVHFGNRRTEPKGGKLCVAGRTCPGWCGRAMQPPQHPKGTDTYSSCSLLWCFRMQALEDSCRAAVPQRGLLAPPLRGRFSANSTNFM